MNPDMNLNLDASHAVLPRFDVDGMLGRVAKWLRILGFDAAYPCSRPSGDRLFVTARTAAASSRTVVVTSSRPAKQLRQLLDQTGIVVDPELLLTRCLICNVPVSEIGKEQAEGYVPGPVFQAHTAFHQCPRCSRIYWEGSHRGRIERFLEGAAKCEKFLGTGVRGKDLLLRRSFPRVYISIESNSLLNK
jgi:hypothetical protein